MANPTNRKEAQLSVDRIHVFRQELGRLISEGVLELTAEQQSRVESYLAVSAADLAARFDIDVSDSQKRISLGMRVLSTLGGMAFCAALVLFFYRIWGLLPTPAQVVILIGAPILALIGAEYVSHKERTPYYTALLVLVALGAFGLNLIVTGQLFNMASSQYFFLATGIFALTLAYRYRLRIPLALALVSLAVFFAATAIVSGGGNWAFFLERPETLIPAGLALAAVPSVVRHERTPDFPGVYRLLGLFLVFSAMLAMMHLGQLSYIPLARHTVEALYRALGFLGTGAAIWLGIRHGLVAVVNLASGSFAVYLFDRLITWWWDWMPRYLIFLIIGLIALLLMAVFRKLRTTTREQTI